MNGFLSEFSNLWKSPCSPIQWNLLWAMLEPKTILKWKKGYLDAPKIFLPRKTKVSLLLFIISLLLLSHFHVYCVGIYSQHSLAGKMHVELDSIENRVNNTNPHEKRNEMPHFGASPSDGVRSVDGLTYCIL